MVTELISFISYVTQILMSLMMISMAFVNLALSRASVGRIVEVLDEEIDITDSHSQGVQAQDGSVVFENVSFKYNKDSDANTLENTNLSISSGETVGIIGGTGSAKTILVQLIPRLYDVSEGRVLVGGHDVRDYKLEELRAVIAVAVI